MFNKHCPLWPFLSSCVQYLEEMVPILDLLKWDQNCAFGFQFLFKPDSDRITALGLFISQNTGHSSIYIMHAILSL